MRQPPTKMIVETSTGPVTAFNNEPVNSITEAVKGPEIQNVKLFIKYHNRPNVMQQW